MQISHLANPTEAIPLLKQLRDKLPDATFAERLTRAIEGGYQLIGARDGEQCIGVLGYRLVDDICWGRTFYIDDLVVDPTRRSEGIGDQMLTFAESLAREQDCDHLRLCSGLTREQAHRFYEKAGLSRFSLQFVKPLAKG